MEVSYKADDSAWVEYEKYSKLQAENKAQAKRIKELENVLIGILRIKDLWLIKNPINDQHISEAEALSRMCSAVEQALKGE